MISNESLIEIIVGACKPQIDNQVDPKQAIACLIGAVGVIALEYNVNPNDADIEIEKTIDELEIKFKDHPNYHLLNGE